MFIFGPESFANLVAAYVAEGQHLFAITSLNHTLYEQLSNTPHPPKSLHLIVLAYNS